MSQEDRIKAALTEVGTDVKALNARAKMIVVANEADVPPGTPAGTPIFITG